MLYLSAWIGLGYIVWQFPPTIDQRINLTPVIIFGLCAFIILQGTYTLCCYLIRLLASGKAVRTHFITHSFQEALNLTVLTMGGYFIYRLEAFTPLNIVFLVTLGVVWELYLLSKRTTHHDQKITTSSTKSESTSSPL